MFPQPDLRPPHSTGHSQTPLKAHNHSHLLCLAFQGDLIRSSQRPCHRSSCGTLPFLKSSPHQAHSSLKTIGCRGGRQETDAVGCLKAKPRGFLLILKSPAERNALQWLVGTGNPEFMGPLCRSSPMARDYPEGSHWLRSP